MFISILTSTIRAEFKNSLLFAKLFISLTFYELAAKFIHKNKFCLTTQFSFGTDIA